MAPLQLDDDDKAQLTVMLISAPLSEVLRALAMICRDHASMVPGERQQWQGRQRCCQDAAELAETLGL